MISLLNPMEDEVPAPLALMGQRKRPDGEQWDLHPSAVGCIPALTGPEPGRHRQVSLARWVTEPGW